MGISRQTLTAYRDKSCPAFRRDGTVDLAKLETWIGDAQSSGAIGKGDPETVRLRRQKLAAEVRVLLILERTRKLELIAAENLSIPVAKVKEDLGTILELLKNVLKNALTNQFPMLCEGKSAAEIRHISENLFKQILERYQVFAKQLVGKTPAGNESDDNDGSESNA